VVDHPVPERTDEHLQSAQFLQQFAVIVADDLVQLTLDLDDRLVQLV